MRKKVYESPKERQKAYRKRKKKAGYRRVVIDVPEHVYAFIKGKPSLLVSAFIEYAKQKGLYMDFDQVSLKKDRETGEKYVELGNKEGCWLKVTDSGKVTLIERASKKVKWSRKVRVYPDGALETLLRT